VYYGSYAFKGWQLPAGSAASSLAVGNNYIVAAVGSAAPFSDGTSTAKTLSTGAIVGIAVGCSAAVLLAAVAGFALLRRKRLRADAAAKAEREAADAAAVAAMKGHLDAAAKPMAIPGLMTGVRGAACS
jgi:hypothetical protein